jgi:hypothetical protein
MRSGKDSFYVPVNDLLLRWNKTQFLLLIFACTNVIQFPPLSAFPASCFFSTLAKPGTMALDDFTRSQLLFLHELESLVWNFTRRHFAY